jgi:hypothetical protein
MEFIVAQSGTITPGLARLFGETMCDEMRALAATSARAGFWFYFYRADIVMTSIALHAFARQCWVDSRTGGVNKRGLVESLYRTRQARCNLTFLDVAITSRNS